MDGDAFADPDGRSVTAEEMRAVDRVAVEEIGLDLPRMMEHAGRGVAEAVLDVRLDERGDPVTVLAGNGGNGRGGLACARHLALAGMPLRSMRAGERRPSTNASSLLPFERLEHPERLINEIRESDRDNQSESDYHVCREKLGNDHIFADLSFDVYFVRGTGKEPY